MTRESTRCLVLFDQLDLPVLLQPFSALQCSRKVHAAHLHGFTRDPRQMHRSLMLRAFPACTCPHNALLYNFTTLQGSHLHMHLAIILRPFSACNIARNSLLFAYTTLPDIHFQKHLHVRLQPFSACKLKEKGLLYDFTSPRRHHHFITRSTRLLSFDWVGGVLYWRTVLLRTSWFRLQSLFQRLLCLRDC